MHPFSFERIAADTAEGFLGSFGKNAETLLASFGTHLSDAVRQPLLLVVMVCFVTACAGIRRSWSYRRQGSEIR